MAGLSNIDHIVVLLLENRSFDHILGYLHLDGRPDVDGLTGREKNEFNGTAYGVTHLTDLRLPADPCHEGPCVQEQIANGNGGFVSSFAHSVPGVSPDQLGVVMGYYNAGDLPVYNSLAAQFLVCDRWHSSVPGPTIPNRLYAVAGTSGGLVTSPSLTAVFDFETVFDRLTAATPSVSWQCFADNPLFSMLRLIKKYRFSHDGHIADLDSFFHLASQGELPSVSWLEPDYGIVGNDEDDDHPPTHIHHAQRLVGRIYNTLIGAAKEAWSRTLFILTYDEHGGLYDHVTPPPSVDDPGSSVGTYGIRVPAFVISPWVSRGKCSKQLFDHTSIIKTILERFAPAPDGHAPAFNARVDAAQSLTQLLTEPAPRRDAIAVQLPPEPAEYYPLPYSPLIAGSPGSQAPLSPGLRSLNDYQRILGAAGNEVLAKRLMT